MAASAAAAGPAPSRLTPAQIAALSPTRAAAYIWPHETGRVPMTIDEITDNFELLDEWDDRYRYIIELGRSLPALPDEARSEANKVRGCASQVWVTTRTRPNGADGPVLEFEGDSDAHIVRGLIAILFALYSGLASISRRSARTASAPWSIAFSPTHVPHSQPDRLGLPDPAPLRRPMS
jgi:sulfur transfer protein SufE